MTTDRIVAFLTERLADDERAALDSILPGSDSDGEEIALDRWEVSGDHDIRVTVPDDAPHRGAIIGYTVDRKPGAHIARHDPRRVLADVAAKRAIVEEAALHLSIVAADFDVLDQVQYVADLWRRDVLMPLARIWSDHADFDPSWA